MDINFHKESQQLRYSLEKQSSRFQNSLILNPVENIPDPSILDPCNCFLHGLYNTDSEREDWQKPDTKIQFSGREQITKDINHIYELWADLLGGEKLSMRLLSGLHAHMVLFMSITDIGQRVMALPEVAGGHMSSYAILARLGLEIRDIPYDIATMRVDKDRCKEEILSFQPDVIFVDRSEGLIYEDFTWLNEITPSKPCYKVFDASQYLTNILCKDYKSPFQMGFDLILATTHKNLPGPQRALVCSKKDDNMWKRLKSGISTYVSNMHAFSIYSAGFLLENYKHLCTLSKEMLENANALEAELGRLGVPVIQREISINEPPTHHCWIKGKSKNQAFDLYRSLERIGLLANYRLLPYEIGYGLRLGLSGATQSGLQRGDVPELASIISEAYYNGYSKGLEARAFQLIGNVKKHGEGHYER